ncbi:PAS domain-containing protein [Calothrix sp. PCC 6303]|uniref:PAS domain-containing protein n=1 Tax=Calothrix sp. PCC 6303 TaxID=1170562 RepID=UPI0002A012D6|nr:PAS domain-containing protein [Calothrix sp. PCC 6303]AFZ04352.1 multi-sensor signal transduction histidine kinase [Calothrix sp. PCC 6303]
MTGLILIVDDESLVRSHLRELLENTGYVVAEAETGEEALSMYSQLHPDLLLLDATMPEMDGFTCCQRLQLLPTGDKIPVLIMTDDSDQVAIEKAFAVGATDYIQKPIQWCVLKRRIQQILVARRTMEELRSLRDVACSTEVVSLSQAQQSYLPETQLRVALQATRMGIWDWDINTGLLTWSNDQQILFGFNPGEFDGKYETFCRCIHFDSRHVVTNAVEKAINDDVEYDIEFRILLPDGNMRWVASKGVVIRDASQVALRMTGVDTDITKRKQNESALEVYANHQALIGELSQLALAGSDLTTLFEWAVFFLAKSLAVEYTKVLELMPDGENLLLRAGVGWMPGLVGNALVGTDVKSQAGYTLLSNEPIVTDLRTERRFYQPQILCDHRVISGVSVLIHGNKRPFGVLGAHTRLRRKFTQEDVYFLQAVANILGTAIERKLSEEALRQSEERFQILARATNDTVWDWNLITNQVWWNESVKTQFGYSPRSSKTDHHWWSDRLHPEEREIVLANLKKVIDGGEQSWSSEYRFRNDSHQYSHIFDRGFVVRNQDGQAVRMIGAMMDITDRKHAQEELVKQNMRSLREVSRSQLFADITLKIRQSLQIDEILQTSVNEVQKLLDADRVLIVRLDPDWSIKVVKEALIPGCTSIQGHDINDPCFNQTYIEKYRQGGISANDLRRASFANIEESNIQGCHAEFLRQFGVKANLVVPILVQNQLWGLLITHQCSHPRPWTTWETELLSQLADQIGIALAQGKLLETETRQRLELARSNEELQQFAFVASHDLQEPLRKIKAFGNRLKVTSSDNLGEQGLDYIERMTNASERMQSLIEDLLMLSRITTRAQPFVPVNLVQVTAEVLSDLEVSLQQTGGQVEVHNLPVINADPIQIRQLLQNLIGNALKFHRPQVSPLIKIYGQILTKPDGTEECEITIEDNGIGFDEKYLDRIFNVFQRLHGRSQYEGTGIGLAICRKIVERHQGKITAHSRLGYGAKFIVTLPKYWV